MPYLLNLVYLALIALAGPWLAWQSVRRGKYREGWREKFLGLVPRRAGNRRCLWLHAVSVGEVNLLATLLGELGRRHPDWECVVSTTTMTGYALARKKYPQCTVFYAPLDFSWAVRRAMDRIRPTCLVLAELELWPNLIRFAQEANCRVAVVNGRLSERSFRGYSRLRPLLQRVVSRIDCIAVQNVEYAERFLALGAQPAAVHVTGSMKYDGAQTDRNNPQTQRLRQAAGFASDDVIFLAGSTQEPEEALALETYRQLSTRFPCLRLVLVPRHPERFDAVAALLDSSGIAWQRRSALDSKNKKTKPSPLVGEAGSQREPGEEPMAETSPHPAFGHLLPKGEGQDSTPDIRHLNPETRNPTPDPRNPSAILLVDAVGELGAWWGVATIGFVGGSLGRRGGQNMIEPAAYGCAVSFGPNTRNFRDIVENLLAHQAAIVVSDGAELTRFVESCLMTPDEAAALGRRARAFVATQLGATNRTVDLLETMLGVAESATSRAA